MPFVLGPLLLGLLPFLAAIVLLGLSQAATAQHGSSNSGTFWDVITGRFYARKVGGWAADFARWIASHFAAGQLRVLARWFEGIGTLTIGLFTANPAALEALVHAIERVMHRGDPRARAKAQTAHRQAVHAGHTATHANVHARSVGHALDHYKGRTNTRVHGLEHRVEVVLPHEIGKVRTREHALSRDITKLWKRTKLLEHGAIKTWDWIRTHPAGAAATAFTGALAAVLSWPAIRALRCGEFGNLFNKRGCGLWNDLDSLLGLLALGLAVENLDTLVKEAQSLEEAVVVGIKDIFGV